MGYSTLATTVMISPNKTSPRNHTIDSVAIHTMAGNLTVESCGTLFSDSSVKASSNYGIDSNGNIAVYVDEDDRSWCTSSSGVDNRAISIEVASMTASEPYEASAAAYESLLQLLVDICQRHNIDTLKWKGDKDYAIAAAAGGPVDEQNMFVHRWFAEKSCPGEWLYSRQGQIASEVNSRLGRGETYTNGASATTTYTTQSVTVNYENISPYMILIDRNSVVDYASLKDAGVIGAIVEAGCYMESNGLLYPKFNNPNLGVQIAELDKLDIPYGLYTTCRARNSVEAKAEMYAFSFPIRQYSPKLGVWLNLEIVKNNLYNTAILNRYKQDLIRLGFKGKMGIICDRDMVSHIEWDNDDDDTKESFKNDFLLWLVEHVTDTSELERLLDPTFFDIDGEG